MTSAETSLPDAPASTLKPPVRVKLVYGLGAGGEAAFTTAVGFVFFYYTAVLGLSGSLVGAALFIGLFADAAVDPFIGSWSDNLRSRLGRRVPPMIVAAPLLAIGLALLFSPPQGISEPLLFAWLAVTSVTVRAFVSLFHVPYIALGAEMADDYIERSSVVAYRAVFGIFTGVAVTALAYSVFFAGEGGLQRPEHYPGFGLAVAVLAGVTMLACALGVRGYAAALPQAPPVDVRLLRRIPGEVAEIFRNRSFRILFLSASICYAAIGVNATLGGHAYVFVWQLRPEMIQTITYAYLGSLLLGVGATPVLSRRLEKKTVVLIGLTLICLVWTIIPGLRALGVIRPTGVEAMWLLAGNTAFAGLGAGLCTIAYPSMMADAADEHEHLFGRRREGLYFAGLGFAFKAASGIGVLLAGLLLDVLRFPEEAGQAVGVVLPEDVLVRLTLAWGPAPALVALVAMVLFTAYAITRSRHAEIAAGVRRRRHDETRALEAAELAAEASTAR